MRLRRIGGARDALEFAGRLARRFRARLEIIGVHQPLGFGSVSVSGSFGYRSGNDALREALRAAVDEAGQHVDNDVRASTLVLDGPVGTTLIAKSTELDLLVAGSRGYGPVRRVLLGSTSRALARGASCPIVVVPRPQEAEATP